MSLEMIGFDSTALQMFLDVGISLKKWFLLFLVQQVVSTCILIKSKCPISLEIDHGSLLQI